MPYIINSACAEIGGTKDAYCMAYGPLSNYEVAVFSDIDAQKSIVIGIGNTVTAAVNAANLAAA